MTDPINNRATNQTLNCSSPKSNQTTAGTTQNDISVVKNTPLELSHHNLQSIKIGGKFTHREYVLKLITEAHQRDIEHHPHETLQINLPDQTGIYMILANNLPHSSITADKKDRRKEKVKKDKKVKKNQGDFDSEENEEK